MYNIDLRLSIRIFRKDVVYGCLFAGYHPVSADFLRLLLGEGKLVDENGISTLNKIVLYFALPALTLYGLQKDASPELIHDLILVFFISLAIMILSGLIAYFLYRREPNERRSVLTNLSMLSNSAYMGYPVVIATLGEDMLIYAVVFVGAFNLMCWTFGSFFFGGISAIQPKKLLTKPVADCGDCWSCAVPDGLAAAGFHQRRAVDDGQCDDAACYVRHRCAAD